MSYFKSAPANRSNFKILWKKLAKFWTKNALFGYFWARIFKRYCRIWNRTLIFVKFNKIYKNCLNCHHPQTCLIAKFCKKTKMPKFVTKKALFGSFCDRTLKNYCHIWNQHSQIYEIEKFCSWIKNAYVCYQKCLILVFLA